VRPHVDGDRVVFLGSVGPEQRAEVLGHAAVLLHPIAFAEPFGLSVVEAMARGEGDWPANERPPVRLTLHRDRAPRFHQPQAPAHGWWCAHLIRTFWPRTARRKIAYEASTAQIVTAGPSTDLSRMNPPTEDRLSSQTVPPALIRYAVDHTADSRTKNRAARRQAETSCGNGQN